MANKFSNHYVYGLILAAILTVIIYLSNIVFPDNVLGLLIVVFLIGLYIMLSSNHIHNKYKSNSATLKVAVFMSLIGFLAAILNFFTIDNIFLNIISQQIDKINTFKNGGYPSTQSMINQGLTRGLIFGIPASMGFGLICGFIGRKLSRNKILIIAFFTSLFLLIIFGINQIGYLKKAHSTFENYYSFRGCVELIKKTEDYGVCRASNNQIVKIVKFENNWYLAGDLPCGFLCF